MKIHPHALAALALTAAALGSAHADTRSFSSNTVALTKTDWSDVLDLPQFDSTLGSLQAVTLDLFGSLTGTAKAESLNNNAADITLNLQATLQLRSPDDLNSILVQTMPLVQQSFSAASHDGVADYAGASGAAYTGLSSDAHQSATFNDAVTLALFTGNGLLHAPVSAKGASYYSGPGNVITSFRTQAGAYATVSYHFAPGAMPERGSWKLLLSGLGAVVQLSARRRA